jgi:hypothetical protein
VELAPGCRSCASIYELIDMPSFQSGKSRERYAFKVEADQITRF